MGLLCKSSRATSAVKRHCGQLSDFLFYEMHISKQVKVSSRHGHQSWKLASMPEQALNYDSVVVIGFVFSAAT